MDPPMASPWRCSRRMLSESHARANPVRGIFCFKTCIWTHACPGLRHASHQICIAALAYSISISIKKTPEILVYKPQYAIY
jgi:hypothetical protein